MRVHLPHARDRYQTDLFELVVLVCVRGVEHDFQEQRCDVSVNAFELPDPVQASLIRIQIQVAHLLEINLVQRNPGSVRLLTTWHVSV